jgi:deoxyribodipyrimidine photo-lyase
MAFRAFPASRPEGLDRLSQFLPRAGLAYELGRNTDLSPDGSGAVSKLSPYLRYRAITEQEVVGKVLEQHDLRSAEKFIQEVLWRTYWKGWLEMRPSVWARFLVERDRQREVFPDQRAILAAEMGQTGIEGFDHWARELVQTGYIHNHARMWFASIWIFTLRLPWALGADYFLRHLIDADAASNTLSWRWVAGLQTVGKSYLATTENIARYTNGRFAPSGLAKEAIPLTEPPIAQPVQLREPKLHDRRQPTMLLITHEDMHPESLLSDPSAITSIIVAADQDLLWGDNARRFAVAAAHEAASRTAKHFQCDVLVVERLDPHALLNAAQSHGVSQIVTPYAPVGPVAERLASIAPVLAQEGILLTEQRRLWDSAFWPYAKKGFFQFKAIIPPVLREVMQ